MPTVARCSNSACSSAQASSTETSCSVYPTAPPHHPERVYQAFKRAIKKHGLPDLPIHGLRHTWATLALEAGIHPKIVSERLGHSKIAVTLDMYSQSVPSMHEEAASIVAGLIATWP